MAALAAALGGGAGNGLFAAATARRFTNKVIDQRSERAIDEIQWQRNVLDLHQVMKVAQNLYLVLEQNNEALLRVGVEIVTCIKNRRVIFWSDQWYSEDGKRDNFKDLVAEKLKRAIRTAQGLDPSAPDAAANKGPDELTILKTKFKEAVTAKEAAQKQQKLAEMASRQAQEHAEAVEAKLSQLQKGQGRRSSDVGGGMVRTRELEEQLESSEAQREELQRQLNALLSKFSGDKEALLGGAGKVQEELAAARKRIAELEEELRRLRGGGGSGHDVGADGSAQLAAALAAERKRHAAELEELRARMMAEGGASEELMKLQREMQEALRRAESAESQLDGALQRAAVAEEAVATLRRHSSGDGVQAAGSDVTSMQKELAGKMEELDKVQGKLAKRDQQLAHAREEAEKLKDERQKMLRTIHTLREQLQRLKDIAQAKGHGNLIKELFDESELTLTMEGEEFNCFARLYEDALRRMDKVKKIEMRLSVYKESVIQTPSSVSHQLLLSTGVLADLPGDHLGDQRYDLARSHSSTPAGHLGSRARNPASLCSTPMGLSGSTPSNPRMLFQRSLQPGGDHRSSGISPRITPSALMGKSLTTGSSWASSPPERPGRWATMAVSTAPGVKLDSPAELDVLPFAERHSSERPASVPRRPPASTPKEDGQLPLSGEASTSGSLARTWPSPSTAPSASRNGGRMPSRSRAQLASSASEPLGLPGAAQAQDAHAEHANATQGAKGRLRGGKLTGARHGMRAGDFANQVGRRHVKGSKTSACDAAMAVGNMS